MNIALMPSFIGITNIREYVAIGETYTALGELLDSALVLFVLLTQSIE